MAVRQQPVQFSGIVVGYFHLKNGRIERRHQICVVNHYPFREPITMTLAGPTALSAFDT
jgi:hypothetical protein